MAHDAHSPACRTISGLLQRIGDKWSVLVVHTLAGGSCRFSELRREIPSVSQRMLTLTLRNLERDGLVKRTVTPTVPPRVDYELTDLGRDLLAPVAALGQWAIEHTSCIEAARARFDEAEAAQTPQQRRVSAGWRGISPRLRPRPSRTPDRDVPGSMWVRRRRAYCVWSTGPNGSYRRRKYSDPEA